MQVPSLRATAVLALALCTLLPAACRRDLVADHSHHADEPPVISEQPDAVPDSWVLTTRVNGSVARVGGDLDAAIERYEDPRKGLVYRFQRARIDTPLPVGYPEPTPPGAIDLKRYPSVRRAEYQGKARPEQGRNAGFWPLFRHIESRGIAMTSPVEMDYHAGSFNRPASDELPEGQRDEPWTMSFLYRTTDDGPVEQGSRVTVRDTDPTTVLSIGVRGDYSAANRRRAMEQLDAWLADNPEWSKAGDPRALYYNDPFMVPMWKWSEVQVPVVWKGLAAPTAD